MVGLTVAPFAALTQPGALAQDPQKVPERVLLCGPARKSGSVLFGFSSLQNAHMDQMYPPGGPGEAAWEPVLNG